MLVRVVLAPGASGTAASLDAHVDALAARGIDATAIDIPKRRAELAVGAYVERAAIDRSTVIGGHSYGGRVASLAAATPGVAPAGLILLSYPLHRPGAPAWEERTSHWARIGGPVLLLSGESDPFARIDLLRRAVAERLPAGELVTWPRVGHGLAPVLDEAMDRIALFLARL